MASKSSKVVAKCKTGRQGASKRHAGLTETTRRKSANSKTGYINVRVQPKLKKDAERVFDQIGVSTSEALTVFLKQVVLHRGIPFPVRIPNAETREAMRELESGGGVRHETLDEMWADLLKPD